MVYDAVMTKAFLPVRVPDDMEGQLRRLGVMIEETNDNVLRLAEGFGMLSDKVDRLQTTVDGHTEMIAHLAEDVSEIRVTQSA